MASVANVAPSEQVEPLRNFEAWESSLRNFAGWLGAAAPGAMDVDFLCERNGQFLVIESKPWQSGVTMPWGQWKALKALSALDPVRVYIAGQDGEVIHLVRADLAPPKFSRLGGKPMAWWPAEMFVPTTKEQLSALVGAWWRDASEQD